MEETGAAPGRVSGRDSATGEGSTDLGVPPPGSAHNSPVTRSFSSSSVSRIRAGAPPDAGAPAADAVCRPRGTSGSQ